jgi:hypothetical protein
MATTRFGRLPRYLRAYSGGFRALWATSTARNLNDVIPYRFVTSKPVGSEPRIVVIVRRMPTIDC